MSVAVGRQRRQERGAVGREPRGAAAGQCDDVPKLTCAGPMLTVTRNRSPAILQAAGGSLELGELGLRPSDAPLGLAHVARRHRASVRREAGARARNSLPASEVEMSDGLLMGLGA